MDLSCIPLPPEITIPAEVSSGLSEPDCSDDTNSDKPILPVPLTLIISAAPPDFSAASKAVERTVINLIGSDDLTVARAFPA